MPFCLATKPCVLANTRQGLRSQNHAQFSRLTISFICLFSRLVDVFGFLYVLVILGDVISPLLRHSHRLHVSHQDLLSYQLTLSHQVLPSNQLRTASSSAPQSTLPQLFQGELPQRGSAAILVPPNDLALRLLDSQAGH